MKLTIEEEKVEVPVRLYLETTLEGNVVLYAEKVGISNRKALLTFRKEGRVTRTANAKIGDFKFDSDGRLIIE